MGIEEDLERFCERAVELGATSAKAIRAEDVVTAEWVRLKCQYGCDGYAQRLTCPPYSPTPAKTRRVLDCYTWAILLHFETVDSSDSQWPNTHEIIAKLEREVFLSDYYSAFGFGSGPCYECRRCNLEECTHADVARPSMEAAGIDVYATARRAGYDLHVVTDESQCPTFHSLLLVR
ncbi:MAG TPA: DUF2284 domain-containing protein [Candidatus Lokiarchaeia archaeon]|nr:DUF2284 domain-containing protein [Candidatus Lokiarchaeia archaeon]